MLSVWPKIISTTDAHWNVISADSLVVSNTLIDMFLNLTRCYCRWPHRTCITNVRLPALNLSFMNSPMARSYLHIELPSLHKCYKYARPLKHKDRFKIILILSALILWSDHINIITELSLLKGHWKPINAFEMRVRIVCICIMFSFFFRWWQHFSGKLSFSFVILLVFLELNLERLNILLWWYYQNLKVQDLIGFVCIFSSDYIVTQLTWLLHWMNARRARIISDPIFVHIIQTA
jgi:hypothetical protein